MGTNLGQFSKKSRIRDKIVKFGTMNNPGRVVYDKKNHAELGQIRNILGQNWKKSENKDKIKIHILQKITKKRPCFLEFC